MSVKIFRRIKMRKSLFFTILFFVLSSSAFSIALDDLQVNKVTAHRIKHFPVPDDNRNYMFFQSVGSDSCIVIGDFSGVQKMIVLINDKNSDNTIDSVVEYFPGTKKFRIRKTSDSKFFTDDIAKLKRDIISGTAFRKNYTDQMRSLDALENTLKKNDNTAVFEDVYGFNIKLMEIDETNKYEALFTYGRNAGGYYMQFKTEYYRKGYSTVTKPLLRYSVYCRDSSDPVVKEYIDSLFKIRAPRAVSMK